MMTRTCAADLAKSGIYMNSVDTGWINDENPLHKAHAHAAKANFQTPIDEVDAAARVLDPVLDSVNKRAASRAAAAAAAAAAAGGAGAAAGGAVGGAGAGRRPGVPPVHGKFLKDYFETEW
jgi:NAD(P)-dependent dehydrogenase (short-subunit alcohol dehydrogenase family)